MVLQHMDSPLPLLQMVFLLARNLASVASRAIPVIDEKTVSHDAP